MPCLEGLPLLLDLIAALKAITAASSDRSTLHRASDLLASQRRAARPRPCSTTHIASFQQSLSRDRLKLKVMTTATRPALCIYLQRHHGWTSRRAGALPKAHAVHPDGIAVAARNVERSHASAKAVGEDKALNLTTLDLTNIMLG